jgi:RNA polymerase sigma-70 factor (ECF subfamily)
VNKDHLVADQTVIDQARAGDHDALGALWRIYQPQLLRLLRAKRAPNAEDVASQVWIDVGRALARFVGDGVDFRRWLFTIANRRTTDEQRRIARRRESSSDVDERQAAVIDRDRVVDLESLDDALDLVAKLPSNLAEAVMLRLVSEMSFADVADVMDTTEGNARVLVHRGLAKLRAEMARNVDSPGTNVRPLRPDVHGAVRIAASSSVGEKE